MTSPGHTPTLDGELGVFAGGFAHDFNNLLTGILGHVTLVQQDLPAESPARCSLRKIEQSALRAVELIQQLLAYSGQAPLLFRSLDLFRLIQDMARLLKSTTPPVALLRFDLAANLPPVKGDAAQLRRVLTNLVANAAEALRGGRGIITIRTGSVEPEQQPMDGMYHGDPLPEGQHVYLEVSDNGCGMDQETLARIFDPFYTTKFKGRGLGLSAVLGIVRAHQGIIQVVSEAGKGSVFRVLLPVTEADALWRHPTPDGALPGAGTIS